MDQMVTILKQVIQILEYTVSAPVCILDEAGNLVGHTKEKLPEDWQSVVAILAESRGDQDGSLENTSAYVYRYQEDEKLLCYILVPDSQGVTLAKYVETMIYIIDSSFQRRKRNLENQKRGLLANQLAVAQKIDSEIDAYFMELKCSKDIPRCAILLTAAEKDGGSQSFDLLEMFERWEEDSCVLSEEDIYGFMNKDILIFKAVSSGNCSIYRQEVEDTMLSLKRYICDIVEDNVCLQICVGSVYGYVSSLYNSYDEANYLLSNIEYCGNAENEMIFIEDYLLEYLYSRMDNEKQKSAVEGFKNMLEKNPIIEDTVVTLAMNNTNLSDGSRQLGIHRNTMQQRLQKMQDDMALNPVHSLRDRIAMRIYTMQKSRKIVWNAGVMVQSESVLYQGLRHLAELLETKSDGMMQLNLHTVATSGDNFKIFNMLNKGGLDMAVGSVMHFRHMMDQKMSVLQMPFLFETEDEAMYVLRKTVLPELSHTLSEVGLLSFDIWSMGWRYLSSKDTPIRVPEDMRKRKIRILASADMKHYFESLEAIPHQIYYRNIKEALASGIIECQENPYCNILDMEIYKYQDFITEIKMFYSIETVCVSHSSWNELGEKYQKILHQAIRETGLWEDEWKQILNERAKENLIREGLRIIVPTTEEEKLWRDAAKPLYDNTKYREFLNQILHAKKEYWQSRR